MPALSSNKPRVVAAMSGGVDSSVAAYLLCEEGYDVVGVTMRLWSADDSQITPDHQGCCSIDDIEDARRVCATLGVPHYVMDVRREFREHVIDYFVAEYRRGRTPHPCIACNDSIKFDFLMKRAAAMDASYVATGHYARIEDRGRSESGLRLMRGVDVSKDQSYVLFGLGQAQLRRVLLPVGRFTKTEIRSLASQAGLHLADKRDSQEICFIPRGDYREFLKREIEPRAGEFVDAAGRSLGAHGGIEFFTVGQRRGLGVTPVAPDTERLFVTASNRSGPALCSARSARCSAATCGSNRRITSTGRRLRRMSGSRRRYATTAATPRLRSSLRPRAAMAPSRYCGSTSRNGPSRRARRLCSTTATA